MPLHWLSNWPATSSSEVQRPCVTPCSICFKGPGCKLPLSFSLSAPTARALRPPLAARGQLVCSLVSHALQFNVSCLAICLFSCMVRHLACPAQPPRCLLSSYTAQAWFVCSLIFFPCVSSCRVAVKSGRSFSPVPLLGMWGASGEGRATGLS